MLRLMQRNSAKTETISQKHFMLSLERRINAPSEGRYSRAALQALLPTTRTLRFGKLTSRIFMCGTDVGGKYPINGGT